MLIIYRAFLALDKNSSEALDEYDSVEGIIENKNNIKGSVGLKIQENQQSAIMSKELAIIKTDVPLEISLSDLKIKKQIAKILIPY